jgi:hypothetical protein
MENSMFGKAVMKRDQGTQWHASRGAHFLTPPKQHKYEIRCYIRDPDGYIIEVGQTTDPQGDWWPAEWPPIHPGRQSD